MEQVQPQDAAQPQDAVQAAQAAAQAAGVAAAQAAQAAQAAGQAAQAAGLAAAQVQGVAAAQAAAAPGAAAPSTPEGAEPKFDQNKLGDVMSKVSAVMSGEAPPESLLSVLTDTGGDFWKGALIGAAGVLLVTNETVKETVSGVFGSMFGGADDAPAEEAGKKE